MSMAPLSPSRLLCHVFFEAIFAREIECLCQNVVCSMYKSVMLLNLVLYSYIIYMGDKVDRT